MPPLRRGDATFHGVVQLLTVGARLLNAVRGLTDVNFIHIEGLGMGPDAAAKAVGKAREAVTGLFALAA